MCFRHSGRVDHRRRAIHTQQAPHQHTSPQVVAQESLVKASRECEFLRELNSQLLANQQALRQQVADVQAAVGVRDAKVADLEEQVRDLMVFLDAQRMIEAEGGELRDGSVVGVQPKPTKGQRRGRR